MLCNSAEQPKVTLFRRATIVFLKKGLATLGFEE